MKIVWKGKYKNVEQLKIGEIPDNAVKFKEPNSPLLLNLVSSIFIIPVLVIIGIAISIKFYLQQNLNLFNFFNYIGILLAYLMIVPHELLHSIAFPKNAEVQLWFSPKSLMAFVFTTYPVSKKRFVYISLLPNIIFGIIPLILWIVIPVGFNEISGIMFSFSFISLLCGVGDYLNVFNTIIQMPKDSVTQLYGFNSYWYKPNVD